MNIVTQKTYHPRKGKIAELSRRYHLQFRLHAYPIVNKLVLALGYVQVVNETPPVLGAYVIYTPQKLGIDESASSEGDFKQDFRPEHIFWI